MESYMKVNTYANVAENVSSISNNKLQDKYRDQIEKLVKMTDQNFKNNFKKYT